MTRAAWLVPNVSLVVLNMIFLQKRDVLLLEGMLLVMCFLTCDVCGNGREVGFADAENPISRLPGKVRTMFFAHPSRRISLHDACDFGRRMYGACANQHVYVVRLAVNDQRRCIHLADDPAKVGEEVVPKFRFDQTAPLVRREDEMQQDVSRGMRHALSPLRGFLISALCTHALRRGLDSSAAPHLRLLGVRHPKQNPHFRGCLRASAVMDVTRRLKRFQIGYQVMSPKLPDVGWPAKSAPKERKSAAHGASRGNRMARGATSPAGAKENKPNRPNSAQPDSASLCRPHGLYRGLSIATRLPRTFPVNLRTIFSIPPCAFSHSRAINNEPRAYVWLAGRFSATLVRVRHLMCNRAVRQSFDALNRPGHGA